MVMRSRFQRTLDFREGKILKRAIVLASQKGGVGKSTVAKAFIDLARRGGRRVSAWDLDRGTGSLALVYQVRDADVGCACEDVRATRAPGAWLDAFHGEAVTSFLTSLVARWATCCGSAQAAR